MTKEKLKPYIYDLTDEDIQVYFQSQGLPKYRAKQFKAWLVRGVVDADELTDMGKDLRRKLAADFDFAGMVMERCLKSEVDDTAKFVFRMRDNQCVESVFMRYKTGTSVCLSTQAGCRMGCSFCASTGIGFGRNLTAGELLAQVILISKYCQERISHVVLMGIGEPFENYDEVVGFIRQINDPNGLNISMRHITLSTCGLIPEIKRLAGEGVPITLAISLHAPTDELRRKLMPIAKKYSLNELIAAAKFYIAKTGRRITFEYALFAGVNDDIIAAKALVKLLRGLLCHVNLIPANEFPGGIYKRSSKQNTKNFHQYLLDNGINATVRRELGSDILAACGQLRRQRGDAG